MHLESVLLSSALSFTLATLLQNLEVYAVLLCSSSFPEEQITFSLGAVALYTPQSGLLFWVSFVEFSKSQSFFQSSPTAMDPSSREGQAGQTAWT